MCCICLHEFEVNASPHHSPMVTPTEGRFEGQFLALALTIDLVKVLTPLGSDPVYSK